MSEAVEVVEVVAVLVVVLLEKVVLELVLLKVVVVVEAGASSADKAATSLVKYDGRTS